jgi:hypothetical protein
MLCHIFTVFLPPDYWWLTKRRAPVRPTLMVIRGLTAGLCPHGCLRTLSCALSAADSILAGAEI